MKSPSLKHGVMLVTVFLLWGVAGGIAGPQVEDLDAPAAKPRLPLARTASTYGSDDVVHLVCHSAPSDTADVPEPDPNRSAKTFLVSYRAISDPLEGQPRSATRALTCFINQN